MTALRRGRFAAVALVPVFALLVACGGSDDGDDEEGEGGTGPCPASISETASTQPPDDIPTPEGADSAYEYFPQGATKVWNFALDGEAGDLVSLRDSYNEQLEGADYEIEGTDAEENAEAEAEFNGPHEGTTLFRTLCDGKVLMRLKLLS
jgi:hypothetical protein